MRYVFDSPLFLYRLQTNRPVFKSHVPTSDRRTWYRVFLRMNGATWPESLRFRLWREGAARDLLVWTSGDYWEHVEPVFNVKLQRFMPGEWSRRAIGTQSVFLRRLPPKRERQDSDIMQIHMQDDGWPETLVFTIYHGFGKRDLLFQYTDGKWEDE